MRSQSFYTPFMPLLFALLGLAWCGYVAFPTATPTSCLTSGCELFRDTRIAGVSLWWVGGGFFFILSILCLKGNLYLARLLAALALLGDAALLVIMFSTAPCLDCLVVAVFIALCYYTLRSASDSWFSSSKPSPSVLLPLWFGLFLGNAVLAAGEQFPLYTLGNTASREVRVFFSPSCPACRTAIAKLGEGAALIPVMEQEEDFDSILRFRQLLEEKVPAREAITRCLNSEETTPSPPFVEGLILRLRLMRNKASLYKQGVRALPLIQINGMPGGLAAQDEGPAAPARAARPGGAAGRDLPGSGADMDSGLPDFLDNPSNIAQCGGGNAEPCE